jgi:two-component system, OmpR family, response regulator
LKETTRPRLLVIEDDEEMLAFLRETLAGEGYEVETAADGRTGLMRAATEEFAALVIDRMLPLLDGIGIISALRSMGIKTPALFLSALGRVDERVAGLRAGGDDYLVKPFSPEELAARLEVLLRRQPGPDPQTSLRVGDLELDRLTRTAMRGGRAIPLKPREFRLLEYLMQNAGQVVTRMMLLEAVWDFHFDPQTSVVESHISRLRAKIDHGFEIELIHTVRGAGYRLADDAQG